MCVQVSVFIIRCSLRYCWSLTLQFMWKKWAKLNGCTQWSRKDCQAADWNESERSVSFALYQLVHCPLCSISSNVCVWFCSADWMGFIYSTELVGEEYYSVTKLSHLLGKLWECQFLWLSSLGHAVIFIIFFSHSGKIHTCRILLMLYDCILKWTVVPQHNFDLGFSFSSSFL